MKANSTEPVKSTQQKSKLERFIKEKELLPNEKKVSMYYSRAGTNDC